MSLDPEKVASILQIELNNKCVGDWYRGGKTPIAIERKAIERATSPESFTDWLVLQYFFRLRDNVELHDFKTNLVELLVEADQTVVPEDLRTKTHNILYIESTQILGEQFGDIVATYGHHHLGIPTNHIKFNHISYPPEGAELIELLNAHTGAVLHNLSLGDLITIHEAINNNPELATKLVIVMTGGTTTSKHDELYSLLKQQDVMVIMKPFPSIDEVIRVVLGVV